MSSSVVVVECDGLGFSYWRRRALRDLTLQIGPGVTALLGPNGAGKSTLLNILVTHRTATSGRVRVLGNDAKTRRGREAIRRGIGYLPQRYPLVGSMRVRDTVAYAAWAQGMEARAAFEAADSTLERLAIPDLARRRVGTLSGGQRQRVGIAAAVAHGPQLLILDEPASGLDPQARVVLRETLSTIAASCPVFLSTHLVEDVAAIAGQVIVLDTGAVAFTGSPTALAQLGVDSPGSALGSALERGYERAIAAHRTRRG